MVNFILGPSYLVTTQIRARPDTVCREFLAKLRMGMPVRDLGVGRAGVITRPAAGSTLAGMLEHPDSALGENVVVARGGLVLGHDGGCVVGERTEVIGPRRCRPSFPGHRRRMSAPPGSVK
jgi:hypothetical protein